MRHGMPWRLAVLASLVLLVSGQLCMLTTCVPRLTQLRAGAHACCRTAPSGPAAPAPPASASHMPCDEHLQSADAPTLSLPLAVGVAFDAVTNELRIAPPAIALARGPVAEPPPLVVHTPAPAGLRAPPLA